MHRLDEPKTELKNVAEPSYLLNMQQTREIGFGNGLTQVAEPNFLL